MAKTWTAMVEVGRPDGCFYPTQIVVADNPGGFVAIKSMLEAQYGSGRVLALYPNF